MKQRKRDKNGKFAPENHKLRPLASYGRDTKVEKSEKTSRIIRRESWTVPQPTTPITEPVYLMDADCGFCQKSMDRIQKLLPEGFKTMPYWEGDLAALGLDLDKCNADGHFIVPSGDSVVVMPGSQSWAGVLIQQGGAWRVFGKAMTRKPLKNLADVVYRGIADNRNAFGSGSCKVV